MPPRAPTRPIRSYAILANLVIPQIGAGFTLLAAFESQRLVSSATLFAFLLLLAAALSIAALWRRPLPAHTLLRISAVLSHLTILALILAFAFKSPSPGHDHWLGTLVVYSPLILTSLLTIIAVPLYTPRFAPPNCPICNHDLRASPASTCPECGTPTNIMTPLA